MSAQVIIGMAESLGARPLSWERDELAEMIGAERDEEQADVCAFLRSEMCTAMLCNRSDEAGMLAALIERLERGEHRR